MLQENHRLIWSALAVGTAALLITGCHKPDAAKAASAPPPPPPTVTVAAVAQQDIVEWDEFTGRTEAVEMVEVRPRVSGHIEEVRFQSGQLVKKGDVLFVIDQRSYKAEFNRRQAEYVQAKVRSENMERESKRMSQLLTDKAISTEEAESREAKFQEAKAGVAAAEAIRDSAKLDVDYTEVRAPIDGRVSRAIVTQGNYVAGVAGFTTLLTTIVTVDPIYVYADVDENSLLKFNALSKAKKLDSNPDGKVPVELQLADETGYPHVGAIESFDNRVDASSGSILLRSVFSNADGRIVPGLFARIRLPLTDRYPALLVDEKAIGTDQGQKFVLALTATNTVEYRAVKLGPIVNGKRVVRTGVAAGEKIVVNGLQRVRPGMPVKAETAVAAVAKDSELEVAKR